MTESDERILISRGGELVPRVPQKPLLSSARNHWTGLRLERHRLPGPSESKGVIEGFQICCNLTGPVPVEWLVNGRWVQATLNNGDLCLATHGEFRSVAWHMPYDLLLLSISPDLMAEMTADDESSSSIELKPGHAFRDRNVEAICRLLLADTAAATPAGPAYGNHLGRSLAIYMARQFGVARPRQPTFACNLPGPVLRRVCELIEARLHTPIGLEDLAREANLSRFYFARLFRITTGDSPYRYLLKRRIERAKELLAHGQSDIEVANSSGFSSATHLQSIFRRFVGLTPRQFRALHK